MNKTICFICLMGVVLSFSLAFGQNKVVVVPLGSPDAAGLNGQVQYNDNGKIDGAEIYYNKSSGYVGIGTTTPGERLVVHGDGTHWSRGFMSLKNDNADAGIRFYDGESTARYHIFNNNGLNDMLWIAPNDSYGAGGITIVQEGDVGIATGNTPPQATLDVNGLVRLKMHDTPPFTCTLTSPHGVIAYTERHTLCTCNPSTQTWVLTTNGTSACQWL